ncbi:hypothetical protein HPP92_022679 [Vanilla planifolia]|uniref:Uncharacterized protein n=1 Tax=Vanilla planifolia TaxID=51239 RepID=A0A835UHG2_VANPL|nr:hypothetical protein HPP92_022679 [Vanilla planifolia]
MARLAGIRCGVHLMATWVRRQLDLVSSDNRQENMSKMGMRRDTEDGGIISIQPFDPT